MPSLTNLSRTGLAGCLAALVAGLSLTPQPGMAQSYRQVEQLRREQRVLPATGIQHLIVDGWGDVQVTAGGGDQITAVASLRAWAPTADEATSLLAALRWYLDPAGGGAVRAGGGGPGSADAIRYRGRRYGQQAQLDLALTVPATVSVRVTTARGDVSVVGTAGATVDVQAGTIRVRQIHGATELQTRSGAIHAQGIKGPAWLTTDAGAVTARDIQGPLVVQAGHGAVDVRQVRGKADIVTRNGRVAAVQVTGDLTATTTTGSITVEAITGPVVLHSTYGRISGRALAGPAVSARTQTGAIRLVQDGMTAVRYELQTTQGPVDLTVPAEASLQADLRTSTGRIETALPFASPGTPGPQPERRRVAGSLNGGRWPLQVRTGSGAIVIRPAR